jgi:hypothetical protein
VLNGKELAQLHLAHEAAHPAVRADAQVAVEVGGIVSRAGRQQGRRLGAALEEQEQPADAGGLDEFPPSHRTPPMALSAASLVND